MMHRWKIQVEDKAKQDDVRYVINRLQDFNDAQSATAFGRQDLRLFVRDDDGTILAGLFANVTMHALVIQILWVEEALRQQGIGKGLVDKAETLAKEIGAIQAVVETTTFQAPAFYEKLGYSCICEIKDCPIGESSLLMRKWF